MNLLQLVTHLRVNILDDTGGQGVDWTSYSDTTFDSTQLRWGNDELVRNINEAIKQIYRRTHPVKDLITIDVDGTTDQYNLPYSTLKILGVRRQTGRELAEVSMEELWSLKQMDTQVGDPSRYCPNDVGNVIRIFPTPVNPETLSIIIYRLPLVDLSWTSQSSVPELRDEFHIPMLFYAAHLCYMKDEANTLDPNRSKTYLDMFDREFPFLSAYSSIRKRRTANRPVSYGGITEGIIGSKGSWQGYSNSSIGRRN